MQRVERRFRNLKRLPAVNDNGEQIWTCVFPWHAKLQPCLGFYGALLAGVFGCCIEAVMCSRTGCSIRTMHESESVDMPMKYRPAAKLIDGVAATLSSLIGHTIFIAGCYFVAALAVQIMLAVKNGVWLDTVCSLHDAMTAGTGCHDYVSNLDIAKTIVKYAATELNVLVLIAGAVCLLSALNLVIGVVRDRLMLVMSKSSSDIATSSGI